MWKNRVSPNGSGDCAVPQKPLFGRCSNTLLKGYDNSDTTETSQTSPRVYIEVCTRFDIWIVFHNQDIHGCCWLKNSCHPQRKRVIFFDLRRNMVLAHAIPTNFNRWQWWTLHKWQIPHCKLLALCAHIILPIHSLEKSVKSTAPKIQFMMREMMLLHHTRDPCF